MSVDYIEATSGFVIIGDIAGFSRRVNDTQRDLVMHLWQFLNSREELGPESGNQAVLNGTGDGALIAFPRISDKERNGGKVIHWRQAVDFAVEWTKWMGRNIGSDGERERLRVGIHQGPFQIINVKTLGGLAQHGGLQIVGLAPNACARVAGLGDGGDVLMSEQFVAAWKEASEVEKEFFDPSLNWPAFRAFVKHGVPMEVRRIRTNRPPPEKLIQLGIVQDQLKKALQEVEQLFIDWVNLSIVDSGKKFPVVTPADVDARLSIWIPNGDRTHLECDFRWHRKTQAAANSRTKYSIIDSGAGPAGRAFCSQKPFVVSNLPEVISDDPKTLARYCKALEKRSGLDPGIAKGFSRYGRAFLTCPLGLRDDETEAVLCIDSEHPLDCLTKSEATRVAAQVMQLCRVSVSALVQLKQA